MPPTKTTKAIVVLVTALALLACTPTSAADDSLVPGTRMRYYHDDAHGVGCWVYGGWDGGTGKAISCMPDSDYDR